MSINHKFPTPTAGMEDTNHTLAASTPGSGHTASADEPNAANMPDGLHSSSFFTGSTNFEDTSDPFPPFMQSNSVSQYFAESEAHPDTASPHTLATQTPIPAHLLGAANTPVFQPESSSTILAQSGPLVNTSSPHTLAAQTPAPARTTFTQVEPMFSRPSTPQPRGSHGPIRTARQQYDRSQPYPTLTRMQPPANAQGQHLYQPQISMTGSPQKQQPGHGQQYNSSHQGIMQPVGVNGGQDYQPFNGHMNDHPQMQLMAYGSEPQTFTGPQNHSDSFAQITEQNSTQRAKEQQQSALQQLQQRARSPFGMTQETTNEQLEDGIDLSQLFQTQDPAQGLNLESNLFSFEGLFQQQGPFQEHDEQQSREQALSRSSTPTAAGIRDSWQSVAREWDGEADQDIAEGLTQAREPCRFQDFLRTQEIEELEQDTTKDATKRPTQYPTPPCSIVATPSVLG
ncbi:hypothetical protein OEA41_010251 [Lepraria neglecta]|uniref:Uncharacterized protein n=1 Tax=Lepraria neglecta TaxID=209136 RepID=A0AAE0DFE1_9LECA|nr:hypothetical protein OEA41_010251 [Lepraria neglecta]